LLIRLEFCEESQVSENVDFENQFNANNQFWYWRKKKWEKVSSTKAVRQNNKERRKFSNHHFAKSLH
jgi:hypothetical protein